MSFIIYDLVLLAIFISLISLFLYKNKKNLKKDGLLILYRTSWGLKLIERTGKKNPRLMKFLSYVSIITGYLLMSFGVYFFIRVIWIYLSRADVVAAVKIPPIMPLIPYLPQMFKLSWLPDFYFIYWIAILAVIAITHEFAHGIFAAYHKIKVKTTGFGFFPYFLPVFLAAFVELDEKRMQKENTFKQLSILAAGTFANVLTAILTFVLMICFFLIAFSPSGVIFDNYAYNVVNNSELNITSINGLPLEEASFYSSEWINISTNKGDYLINPNTLENNSIQIGEDIFTIMYYNSPAIRANLTGAISEINNIKINSIKKLSEELSKYKSGETVKIKTISDEGKKEYQITLENNPLNESKSWIGIVFSEKKTNGFVSGILQKVNSYKNANLYYTPNFGELSEFIYNLLWWLFLISISVALVNMLPVGIFDGGRFFYLTILFLTKSEKKSKKAFSVTTYIFLFLLILIMAFWAKSFI
jgi:membrane-associated protease RseP (regulator of RpoE activity)